MARGRHPAPVGTRSATSSLRVALLLVVLASTLVVVPSVRGEAAPIPETSTSTVFEPGAYIIDMGVEPQTIDNTLKAYGLIYSLMIENLIPVEWIISDAKTGDGLGPSDDPDFVYDGQEFKGGPFVIRAEYAELAEAVFADPEWAGLNIVGPTTETLTIPVFKTLTNWPNAILDDNNGAFGESYFQDAGIPEITTSAATGGEKIAYQFKDPQLLDSCDDIYVMPHADPEWATHSNLVPWNADGGYIWAGCHAVSVMEQATNPGDLNPDPDMNFLSTNGLIDFGDHDDGTTPYTYTTDVSDPIMQFVGRTDDAHQNGSEQIYLPAADSAWRPGTKVLVYDTDHPDLASSGGTSPGEAAALVYGRGFDDPDAGLVMYEGGHSIDTGAPSGVAAVRAYMNLHLLAGIERGLEVTANVPDQILAGSTVEVSAVVEGGDPDYIYQWVSSCGGTFTPAEGVAGPGELITADFTAPADATDCQVSIDITDFCGRGGFDKVPVEVVEEADLSITKTDDVNSVSAGGELTYTLTITNDGPNDATGVTVVDTWPVDKVTFVSATPQQGTCAYNAGTLTCEIGDIPVGASVDIQVVGTVKSGAEGEILNSASVDANQIDPDPGDNTDTDTTLVSGLRLVKSANPSAIDLVATAGEPVDVTFTFEVSNVGPGDLSDIAIADPDVPSCVPAYQSGDVNEDGVLQVGEVWVFTCVVAISGSLPPENLNGDGDFVNTATATGTTDTGDVVDATDSAVVELVAPGITIEKGPDGQTVTDGGGVSFDITVTNSGDTVLEDVTVTDPTAPACDRYLGDMQPGDVITYQCELSPPLDLGPGTNSAGVEGQVPGGGAVTDTDGAEYDVVAGALDITKVPVDCSTGEELPPVPAYYVGDTVCYEVEVTNTGDTTQTDVTLTDDLPTGLDHVESTVTAPRALIEDDFDRDVNDNKVYDAGWTEFGDNADASGGDVNVRSDGDCPEGAQCLYVKNDDAGVYWATDLSSTTTIDISYEYTIKRRNRPGRFYAACWDGAAWVSLGDVSYGASGATPDGPFTVDLTGTALPASCQIAAGRIGLIVADPDNTAANGDNEVLFDSISITTATDSISDDFENYEAESYYSTGIVPGWAEYNDDDPARRDGGDVRSADEIDPSQDCATPGECAVAIRKRDKGLVWPADYSTFGECAVSFDYRIYRIDKGEGVIRIGGLDTTDLQTWVATHDTIPMTGTTGWLSYSTTILASDLPGVFTATGAIGVSHGTVGSDNDRFAVDNVTIACVDTFTTTDHPVIVDAGDGIDLAPGASIVAEIEAVVTEDGAAYPRELVNVASTTSDQQPDPSTDTAEVERVLPDIALEKTVEPELVAAGETVTYTFTVTNPGNEPLENVTIIDPDVPGCTPALVAGDTNGNDILNPGEEWILTCDVVVTESFTNTAFVEGDPITPGSGEDGAVTDSDDAAVEVVVGGIEVVKSVDKPIIRPGEPVTYTYEVTVAPGTTEPLSDVVVTDDKCAPVNGPTSGDDGDLVLQPDETWLFTCSTTLSETTTNIAEASGTDRAGVTHTDTDDEVVTVIDPDIALVKSASPTEVAPGGAVTFTFEVTNPGNDPLSDVTLTDDTCSPVVFQSGDNGNGLLDPGETWTYTCTTTISEDTTNIAEVGGTDSLGKIWTDTDTADVNVVVPSVVVAKEADTSLVFPGEEVTYRIVVYNDGDFPFTTIDLTDDNCSPLAYESGDVNTNDALDPGEGWVYTCTTTLDETTRNTVTVDVDGPGGPATDTDSDRVRVHDPLLDITKVADDTLVPSGTEVTYTYEVTNVSVCGAFDLTCQQDHEIIEPIVTDDKCAPVEYVSGDIDGDGRMVIGETWVYECTTTITEDTTNIATVEGDDVDGRPIPLEPPTATETVEVEEPELSIVKASPAFTTDTDGSGDLSAGDVLTYTITAYNTGNQTLTDVVVTDDVITPTGGTTPCATVEPGGTCTLVGTYVVTAEDVANGGIVNTATADSTETGPVIDTVTTPTPTPLLTIEKSDPINLTDPGSEFIEVDDVLEYTITVTNVGSATLTDVVVSDDTITPTGGTTPCAVLEPGDTCTLIGTYVVTEADVTPAEGELVGTITNTASASSDQTGEITDQVVTQTPTPALEVEKALTANADDDGSGDVSEGDVLTYTVLLTNVGTAPLTGVTISDSLYPDSPFTTCGPDEDGSLDPGETCELTYTYTVTAEDVAAGIIRNTATGDSTETPPDTDGVDVLVPQPRIAMDKTAPVFADPGGDADGSGDFSVGDVLTYEVTVTNIGTATLTGVEITDPLYGPDPYVCPEPLAPGETCVLRYDYTITSADLNSGVVINPASAISDQTDGVNDTEVTPLPRPNLTIDKQAPQFAADGAGQVYGDTDGSGDFSVGDVLQYRVVATNTGTANLTDVTVTDPKLTPSSVTCALVPPGGTCVLVGTYTVTAADLSVLAVRNTAGAESDQTRPVIDIEVTPLPEPAFTITKDAPVFADPDGDADGSGDISEGDTLTYTVTVTNTGEATLTGVTITDPLFPGSPFDCPDLAPGDPDPPGDTCELTYDYVVTAADVERGRIVNTATGDTDQTRPSIGIEVTPVPRPDFSVAKTSDFADPDGDADGSGDVSVGDTLTYTVTITNTGTATLTGVTITDPVYGPDPYVCPDLAPGATCVLEYDYLVTQADVDAGVIVNTAVGDTDQTDPDTGIDITPVPTPGMTITKDEPVFADPDGDADGSGDVSVGDTLTYTVTLTNTGDSTLTGVTISDPLYGADPFVCPDLAPEETCVLEYDHVVTADDVTAGQIVNTATGDSDQTEEITDQVVTPVPEPGLSIVKDDPVFADPGGDADGSGDISEGDTLTYTVTVTNTGDSTLTSVTISDPLYGPDPFVCPDLAPGASCELSYDHVVTGDEITAGAIVNTATGDSDQTDPVIDVVTTPTPFPLLLLDKADPINLDGPDDGEGGLTLIEEGDVLRYRITATNIGTAVLTNVVVSDTSLPPPGLDPSSVTCPILRPGEACVLEGTYTVTADDIAPEPDGTPGLIVNTASVDTDQTDPVIDQVITPTPSPELDVEKTSLGFAEPDGDADLSTDVSEGDTLVYRVTVTNVGTATLTGVTIEDPLYGDTPYACPAALAPGDTCVLEYEYVVTAADVAAGIIRNTATGDSVETGENTDDEDVLVPRPRLDVVKSAPDFLDPDGDTDGSGDFSVGDVLEYRIIATNTGTAVLTDVVVSDPLLDPPSTTCDVVLPGGTCELVGTYTVAPEDVAAGRIINVAEADSDQTEGVTDSVVTPLPRPGLTIEKGTPEFAPGGDVDGSGDFSVGDVLTYTVTATNTGSSVLTDVTVTDLLLDPSTITCAQVAVGGTCVLEGTYTIDVDDLNAGRIVNVAGADSDQTEEVTDSIVTPLPRPNLTVDKTGPFFAEPDGDADGSGDISEGDTLTYTVTVTNVGSANLTDVTIEDALYGPDPYVCPDLAPGETCVLTYDYEVTADDVAAGEIVNTAVGGSEQTGDREDQVVEPLPTPDVSIVKSDPVFADPDGDADGSGDVSVGDTLLYTVTLTNTGTATLTGVTISDTLYPGSPFSCPDLDPGETCVLTYTHEVTADDLAAQEIVNTATGDTDQTGEITDQVVTPVPQPSVDVRKDSAFADPDGDADGSGDVSAGDVLTYTVTVTNTGTATLTGVTIEDPLYPGTTYACPDLAPGQTCVLVYDYTVTPADVAAGAVLNVATVDTDQTEPDTGLEIVPVPRPSMSIDKGEPAWNDVDGSGGVSEGDILTYSIIVTNTGRATLTNVVVEDTRLPDSPFDCGDLAPGDTCEITGQDYVVTAADVAAGEILNVAAADSDQTEEITDQVVVPVPRLVIFKDAPELIDDADSSDDVSAGDTLEYTITVFNTGTTTLTGVTIDDPLFPGSPFACGDGGDGVLEPGESCELTYTYVVDADDVTAGEIVNTAVGDSDQTLPETGEVTTEVGQPAVTIVKGEPVFATDDLGAVVGDVDGSGDVSAGDVLTYTVVVENTGESNLTGVTITDPLDPNSPFVCDGGGDGVLSPGETCELTYDHTVTASDVNAGVILNVATVDSTQTDPDTDAEITPVPRPGLTIVKDEPTLDDVDGSGGVSAGDVLSYRIILTNSGRATLTGVSISDPLYPDSPFACGVDGDGVLAPGETCTLEFDYTVSDADVAAGEIVNTAVGDSDQTEGVTDKVVTPVPKMVLVKEDPVFAEPDGDADLSGDISVGDTLSYTVTIYNTGTATLTGVTIDDPLFPGSPFACGDGGDGVLEPGESCELTYTYVVDADDVAAGEIVNEATGDSDQTGPETGEVTTPLPFPRLRTVKADPVRTDADGSGDLSAGDTLTYTVRVTNIGTATLTGVTIEDDLYESTLAPTDPYPYACPDLAPLESCVLTYDYVVTTTDVARGRIINTAIGDSDQTGASTDRVVTPVPQPRLRITKPAPVLGPLGDRDGSQDVSVGDVLTYTVTATNIGTANLVDVVVTDDLIRPSSRTCALLEPGETCVLVGVYIVTADDLAAGVIANTATAGTGTEGVVDVTDNENVIVPRPAVTIDKSAPTFATDDGGTEYGDVDGSTDISVGDVLAYTVTARNVGTANLTDVVVTDPLLTPSSITCPLVAPGETCVLVGLYTVTADDVAAGVILNVADVGSTQTGEGSGTDSEVTAVPRPAMTVEKTGPENADEDGSGDVTAGDTLTYTVTATNTGTAFLTNVVVSDPMLEPDVRVCELLAPGAACVLEGTYVVTAADVLAGTIVNDATGDSDQTEPGGGRVTIDVPPVAIVLEKSEPDLTDDADGSGDMSVGDTLTYTIVATNTGEANLTDVVITDDRITTTGGTSPCDLVEPGGTCTLVGTYVITEADLAAGRITNVAEVVSTGTDPITDEVTVELPWPDLALQKPPPTLTVDADDSGSISVGDTLTFTITATNTGTANLVDVVIVDEMITPSSIDCPLMVPGATCVLEGTYVVTEADAEAGTIANEASAGNDWTDVLDEVLVAVEELPATGAAVLSIARLALAVLLLGGSLLLVTRRRHRLYG